MSRYLLEFSHSDDPNLAAAITNLQELQQQQDDKKITWVLEAIDYFFSRISCNPNQSEKNRLLSNAFFKLCFDYKYRYASGNDSQKNKARITALSKKLAMEIFQQIDQVIKIKKSKNEEVDIDDLQFEISEEIRNDLGEVFQGLDIDNFKGDNLHAEVNMKDAYFFNDFLKTLLEEDNISSFMDDFFSANVGRLDKSEKEQHKKKRIDSAVKFSQTLNNCLDKYCSVNSNSLKEDNLKEIKAYSEYIHILAERLKGNDEDKENNLSKLLNAFIELPKQFKLREKEIVKDADDNKLQYDFNRKNQKCQFLLLNH